MASQNGATLLSHSNESQFQLFLTNDDETLTLPVVSQAYNTAISVRGSTVFKKINCSPKDTTPTLFLITENNNPHSFVWHTRGANIKQGVRWGMIKPASLTGQVIATLGHYRLSVHERITKGLATATQCYKLDLLDHFQDRISALSALESLVNQDNSYETFHFAFENYKAQLKQFSLPTSLDAILPGGTSHCQNDIESAIKRIDAYLKEIKQLDPINAANRARGEHAILEFVKRESMQALYELQGLNQGITYSNKRQFALTRGELDEDIVDALKVIDDHRGDPRNLVTAAHHCNYPDNIDVSYHLDPLSFHPNHERLALMAISYIEGWDKVNYDNPVMVGQSENKIHKFNSHPKVTVTNAKGEEADLTIYRATKWRIHRNFTAFRKSVGHFFWNAFKNFFISVRPWEGEAWKNPSFHLYSHELYEKSRPTQPLWRKIFHFLSDIYYAFVDFFKGIRDFGYNLVVELPRILKDDWDSTRFNADVETLYKETNHQLSELQLEESHYKNLLLNQWANTLPQKTLPPEPKLAPHRLPVAFPYALNPGKLNDILNSVVRGLDGFMSVFTHHIYSKDPFGGVLFTLAYMSGGAALLLPDVGKTIFGEAYVLWFTKTAKVMAATPLAGTLAAGSTQAQIAAWAWDILMHGPRSGLVEGTKEIIKDPLTISICFWLAYGVGYALANGINGVEIPGLSESLREEAGTTPETSYPITGAKVLITLYEILHTPDHPLANKLKFAFDDSFKSTDPDTSIALRKIKFSFWLASQHSLSKLNRKTKFSIEQHIDYLFEKEEAASLKQLLYPPKPRSIAYQILFIPLSYIQVILRMLAALSMSAVAWLKEKSHPWRPVQRAGDELASKVAYDLTRLLIFTYELLRMVGKGFGCVFKAFVYSANFAISRLGGLVGLSPDHAIHRGFARIHRGIMNFREWIFPARIHRAVNIADPISTVFQFQSSYELLRNHLHRNLVASNETIEEVAVYTTPDISALSPLSPQSELSLS